MVPAKKASPSYSNCTSLHRWIGTDVEFFWFFIDCDLSIYLSEGTLVCADVVPLIDVE